MVVAARSNPRDRLGILWVLGSDTKDPRVPRTNGVEVLFARMAPLIDRDRFDVAVAYPDYGPMAAAFDAAGMRRFPFPSRRSWNPRLFMDVEAMLRATRARVVHSNSGPLDLHVAAAARLHGAAHITTRHVVYRDREVAAWRRRAYELIDQGCLRLGTRFVAIADYGREVLVAHQGLPPARVSVVHNGCDVPPDDALLEPAAARSRLGLPAGAPLIGMVARLEPHKGGEVLLRAAAQLGPRHRGLQVVFAGTGPDEPRLSRLAAEVGVGARFLGFVRDVGTLYDALDALVLPSLGAEGVPNVLCEALGHRCPCVATRVAGVPDVILDGETGLLVEPGDTARLAGALDRLLADAALRARLGAQGRAHIATRFSLAAMVRGYEAVYVSAARPSS
jgi:glycosyltransferase involved in cell wall biosynthesis